MKNFSKEQLEKLYLNEKKNPYEIAEELKCNHKTVRRYLKLHKIKLRTASEYNFLSKASHTKPTHNELYTNKSIAAHTAFLCEGWHTEKTNHFYFCNTDPSLCDLIIWCLDNVYKVSNIRLVIVAKNKKEAQHLKLLYPNSKFVKELDRRTPILRIFSGGKMLARDFIQNAYTILYNL